MKHQISAWKRRNWSGKKHCAKLWCSGVENILRNPGSTTTWQIFFCQPRANLWAGDSFHLFCYQSPKSCSSRRQNYTLAAVRIFLRRSARKARARVCLWNMAGIWAGRRNEGPRQVTSSNALVSWLCFHPRRDPCLPHPQYEHITYSTKELQLLQRRGRPQALQGCGNAEFQTPARLCQTCGCFCKS